MKTVTEMTTAELVAEYNELTGKSIKKFSSRAAGEKQVQNARDEHKGSNKLASLVSGSSPAVDPEKVTTRVKDGKRVEKPVKPAKEPKIKFDFATTGCPSCKKGLNGNVTAAGQEGTVAGDKRAFCHECGTEFWTETGKTYNAPSSANRSEAIAKTWEDPAVKAKRSKRDNVKCNGAVFRSVLDAFRKLRLPVHKHIKFRMVLKELGTATFEHDNKQYEFELTNSQKELAV